MLSQSMGPLYKYGNVGLQHSPTEHMDANNNIEKSVLFLLEQVDKMNAQQYINSLLTSGPQQKAKLDRSFSDCSSTKSNTSQYSKNIVNPSRYKTEVCRPFNESGFCKYGDKCQFAHGDQELRGLPRHPKYKTELCRTFHTTGVCPYGPRCHFIHNEDTNRLLEISQMKIQHATKELEQRVQVAQLQMQQQQIVQLSAIVNQMQALNSPTTCDSQRRLAQSISLFTPVRDNLGSVGDSPPESIAGSPTILSPVFSDDTMSDLLSPVSGDLNSSFNFSSCSDISPYYGSPVKQEQSAHHVQIEHLQAELASQLQAMSIQQNNVSPPSSPDDLSQDGNTKFGRLPVFSRLASKN